MADYLLVESRDPFEYADTSYFYQMAEDLCKAGNNVTFFLVQNGVLMARKGISNDAVARLRSAAPAVKILADDFSLRERAISADKLADGVTSVGVDQLVDLLAEPGVKAVWH
ncbi:MAG: DsrE family protein [Chloroflexota bacterium]|nr:DsrE family protein [Chloroflexota bacterium]